LRPSALLESTAAPEALPRRGTTVRCSRSSRSASPGYPGFGSLLGVTNKRICPDGDIRAAVPDVSPDAEVHPAFPEVAPVGERPERYAEVLTHVRRCQELIKIGRGSHDELGRARTPDLARRGP